ncbi:hypothetical protein [Elizabethkingia meningoseptica]|uniref:hypothetical protein n=1 Tax=Elizabethkingia meningoseptica TaxID=238 RepID=UPI002DD69903|nr:hypothetical protein [Elizabethkingia meningoseptica]MEC4711837.1 hypothetical protein [Elizabethkingia meningoseptica]
MKKYLLTLIITIPLVGYIGYLEYKVFELKKKITDYDLRIDNATESFNEVCKQNDSLKAIINNEANISPTATRMLR